VNVPSPDAQSGGNARRRRRAVPVRRVPTVINEPERKRVLFGLGGDRNHREREALKERVALLGGIALAVIVAAVLAFGLLHDAVIVPYQQSQANAKPVAKIGTYTLTTGYFKRFVHFNSQQLQNQISTGQQEETQLQGNPKNAAQLSQIQQQVAVYQSQLQTLPQDSLTQIISGQTVLQTYKKAGVSVSQAEINKQLDQVKKSTGGKDYFQQFLKTSELSQAELTQLLQVQLLETKLQKKLSKGINQYEAKVRASHILVKSKSLAQKLLKEAQGGADFAALAKKYSTDTGSAKKGGDLGYFAKGTMVAPFSNAAFSMKVGEIRLVHSQFGYHIIKVTGHERVKMTGTDLQNAQSSAYSSWLQKQQAAIGVQKFIKTADLPGKDEIPTVNPLTNIQPTVPVVAPTVVATPATGKTATTQSTATGAAKATPKPKSK
jgi:foldase protein PrsA